MIEVKTPLTHRDYSHLVDQEVGKPFQQALKSQQSFHSGSAPFDYQQDPSVFHVQQPVFPAGHLQGALPPQVFKSHSSHVIKKIRSIIAQKIVL